MDVTVVARQVLLIALAVLATACTPPTGTTPTTDPITVATKGTPTTAVLVTTSTVFHPGLGLTQSEQDFYLTMVDLGVFPPFDINDASHATHTGAASFVRQFVSFLEEQMRAGQWGTCDEIGNELVNAADVLSDDYSEDDAFTLVVTGPLFFGDGILKARLDTCTGS